MSDLADGRGSGGGRNDIEIVNSDGSVSIRETIAIVFYMREPHLTMLDEVAAAIREFAALVSFSALTSYYDYEGEQEDLGASALDQIIEERFYSPGRFQNANIVLTGRGVHAPEFHLWYSGTAIDNPELRDEASYLWCWVPRRFFREKEAAMMAYIASASARLPFTSGYVSPALAGEDKFRMQALGWRHPGLDLARPLVVSSDIGDRAAGSCWLNFLGPRLTRPLGGSGSIRAELPPDIAVEEFAPEKCRISLTPEPQIGDVNRRDDLPSHKVFARFLESHGVLHVPDRAVYFVDADSAADKDAMQRWHRRFL